MFLIFNLLIFLESDPQKLEQIKLLFYDSWIGYKKCAFGYDFLCPISCSGSNWLNSSLTLIDSLDTLYIMGFKNELEDSIKFLENNFTYKANGSVFELIIRVVGGLLSAYQFTQKQILLTIASNFTKLLLPAFNSPTNLPKPNINMTSGQTSTWGWAPRSSFLAHVGSLAPELMTLSQFTNDLIFKETSDKILEFFFKEKSFHGLWPQKIDFNTGLFSNLDLNFDAYCDSFYEYLLKLYILSNKKCTKCGKLYEKSIKGMKKFLLREINNSYYVGGIKSGKKDDNLSYLSYFFPGLLALGSIYFNNTDLELAENLTMTAYEWHKSTKSGLSPESFVIKNNKFEIINPQYKLRPEFIESCFYLYRITGKNKWREIGWEIFQNIIKYCKAPYGFGTLKDVNQPNLGIEDIQDSFLLAETFKYIYLLFSNSSYISINEYIFTTEAHPLKNFNKF